MHSAYCFIPSIIIRLTLHSFVDSIYRRDPPILRLRTDLLHASNVKKTHHSALLYSSSSIGICASRNLSPCACLEDDEHLPARHNFTEDLQPSSSTPLQQHIYFFSAPSHPLELEHGHRPPQVGRISSTRVIYLANDHTLGAWN